MMPEINGFDVAAVLKNDPQTMDIPIIILSIVEDRTRGFRLGVDRYFTKPIDTTALFREVGTLLEQGRSTKRVLVVDEDASAVKMLSDVLQAQGIQRQRCPRAGPGRQGRGDAARHHPAQRRASRGNKRSSRRCGSKRVWRTCCSWSTSSPAPRACLHDAWMRPRSVQCHRES